jgi:hypothetical protein
VGCTPPHSCLESRTKRCVGCTPPRSHLESQTRRCVGCTPPRWHLEGRTRRRVGSTPPRWPLERCYRREGAQTPSSPPAVSPFSLLPPLPSPSYSLFCAPHSLGLRDVAFDGGRLCWVTWRGAVVVGGDVARGCCRWRCVTWRKPFAHIPR